MSNILLISAPGAGKGIASEYLEEKYNLVHMSIGNLLREESINNNLLKKELEKGNFVDNNIVYRLFDKFLIDNSDSNFVFEGFPRLIEQIKPFESILEKHNIILDKIIFINIDKQIALKRITGRMLCSSCDGVYNKYYDDIKDLKCKKCKSSLYKRTDDNKETYENRYKIFEQKTLPVLRYFKGNFSNFFEISNNGTIEEFYSKLDFVMKNNYNIGDD